MTSNNELDSKVLAIQRSKIKIKLLNNVGSFVLRFPSTNEQEKYSVVLKLKKKRYTIVSYPPDCHQVGISSVLGTWQIYMPHAHRQELWPPENTEILCR